MTPATIRKASRVFGRTLVFRDACVADAAFIHALRADQRLARFLSPVAGGVTGQQRWLESYRSDRSQAYFIIEQGREPVGTVRLYDAREDSFCWGSWILSERASAAAATESALMVYAYALDWLGFARAHFDVRRGNERVVAFHRRCGAREVGARDADLLFELEEDAIRAVLARYRRYLPDGVQVEGIDG